MAEIVADHIGGMIFDQFSAGGVDGAGEDFGDEARGEGDRVTALAVVEGDEEGVPVRLPEYRC